LNKFDYLLRHVKITLHTDHENLVYIRDTGSTKVLGWKCLVQEFDFNLQRERGDLNVMADWCSRNPAEKNLEEESAPEIKTDLDSVIQTVRTS
jgi:hypothetical protein